MPIREIPRSFEYTCDRCGKAHVQENANLQYANGRPPGWDNLTLTRCTLSDWADQTIKHLLCPPCSDLIAEAIDKAMRHDHS